MTLIPPDPYTNLLMIMMSLFTLALLIKDDVIYEWNKRKNPDLEIPYIEDADAGIEEEQLMPEELNITEV